MEGTNNGTKNNAAVHTSKRRAQHKNSHHGCSTCKSRHLRCDETKPVCLRCQKAGRQCINDVPTNKFRVFRGFKATNIQIRPRELDYFDHFINNSLRILSSFEPSPLWAAIRESTSRQDSAVRHIAAAVGAQHLALTDSASPQDVEEAYIGAVHALHTSMNSATAGSIPEILMASLLLAVLQCLRGSVVEAMVHIHGGVQIAKDVLGSLHDVKLRECLRWLEKLALKIAISESRSNAGVQAMGLLHDLWVASPGTVLDDIHLCEASITTAERQLIRGLLAMVRIAFERSLHGDEVQKPLEQEQFAVVDRLKMKRDSLEEYLRQRLRCPHARHDDHVTFARKRLALARCLLLKVFFNCVWAGTQTIYDTDFSTFKQVIDLLDSALARLRALPEYYSSTQLAFFFGLGSLTALSIICARCREPDLRRRAIALLDKCPPREGIWTSTSVLRLSRTLMACEESRCTPTGYIPEEARIHHYILKEEQGGEGPGELIIFRHLSPDATHYTRETIQL